MGSISLLSAAARRLEGKVALITGGASGIGEATAKLFSKHGAKVVIADIQDELGHSVCKDLSPQSTSFVHCDVTKEIDVENAVNLAVSKFGKLDIMFNNAGVAGVSKTDILDITKPEFEQVIGVNLVGVFLGTKHAARAMIPARQGSIISTASVCSVIGDDDGVHSLYSNLKGRVLKAEDVAEAALYLGSDESKYYFEGYTALQFLFRHTNFYRPAQTRSFVIFSFPMETFLIGASASG
ncbi:hypothetical protein FH972_009977 [Carpinus fangiana]|uniref:Secoisolariciresinol dehydrogenase-like n=1 Tax=Carpinus fangiana TaxID=176857 RepID=A0A660KPM5_9ROSI|nr:hypothetical protein FH972_009977 [Carpinus fangiana]